MAKNKADKTFQKMMYDLTGHLDDSGLEYKARTMMSDDEWKATISRSESQSAFHKENIEAFQKMTRDEKLKHLEKMLSKIGI